MDWSKALFQAASHPPPGGGNERQRRYVYDDPSWRDDEPSSRALAFSSCNALMPCANMEMKLESPTIHEMPMTLSAMELTQHDPQQMIQSPMSDCPVFPMPGMSMMAHDYVGNGGYGLRSPQTAPMPTLSSYFNGGQGPAHLQPPSDYFGEALHGFPTSEAEAATSFPAPPPPSASAVSASLLESRSGDFGEMPTDVGTLLTPHQLNQMLVTPPSSMALARSSVLSPVGLPPARTRLSAESCFAIPPAQQQQQQQYLNAAVDTLAVETDPKFSPDRRKLCCIEGCKSQARAFNRCKRHGGSKRCVHAGCTKSVQSRGLCIRHGGGSRCQEPGCTRAAQSHGKCKMHGGGRPCMVEGCDKKAHLKRLCRKHGGGAKCSVPNCEKWAQRVGKCMTHSKDEPPRGGSDSTVKPEEVTTTASTPALALTKQEDVKCPTANTAAVSFEDSTAGAASIEQVHV